MDYKAYYKPTGKVYHVWGYTYTNLGKKIGIDKEKVNAEDCVLLEYTGIKDSVTGEKIYEYDVVQILDDNLYLSGSKEETVGYIHYDIKKHRFVWKGLVGKHSQYHEYTVSGKTFIKVGDIFEKNNLIGREHIHRNLLYWFFEINNIELEQFIQNRNNGKVLVEKTITEKLIPREKAEDEAWLRKKAAFLKIKEGKEKKKEENMYNLYKKLKQKYEKT